MSLANAFAHIDAKGALYTITRPDPPGPAASVTVKFMQRNAMEMPLMGDVSQEDTIFFVRHTSLTSAGFPAPTRKGDRISADGSSFVVRSVFELPDGVGGIGGYRMVCRGS